MKKYFVSIALLMILSGTLFAQETSFGKNKVQYRNFEWSYIQTRHFDIYYYENAYQTAKFAAAVEESAYVVISQQLNYRIQRRIPIFIYNSSNDFQQTNIISSILPEAVGGFTEAFKNRVAVPFTGSYEEFRHVLHHELTHAMIYDLLFGGTIGSIISQRRLFDVPLWFIEGYAEYSSRYGWDFFTEMYVRDATINAYLEEPEYLGGFLAYKQGQAMLNFIADKYGAEKIGEILQKGKIYLSMNKALKTVLNIDEKQLWEEFSKEMKRRFWPEIAKRKEPKEFATRLTKAREDGSYYNERPVFSPEGDKIAMFTDRKDYSELVLISALDGKVIDRLVKGERSGEFESFHSYYTGMSFSPDGRKIVFVAKSKGRDGLMIYDLDKKEITRRKYMTFYNTISPAWSPDGKMIAFSALEGYNRDLYIWNLETDELQRLFQDQYDDVNPSWLPDCSRLVFASDRPHPVKPKIDVLGQPYKDTTRTLPGGFHYGEYNIFQIDLSTKNITPIDVGPGSNHDPVVSPDGKRIAFISNRNGIENIYVAYLDSAKSFAVTDILTGIQSLSWSPDGQKIAFSAFNNGVFDVFILKKLTPTGDDGVLEPTGFAAGEYNATPRPPVLPIAASDSLPDDSTSNTSQSGIIRVPVTDSSMARKDTLTTPPDSLAGSRPDSLQSKPNDKTGLFGDEFVFVSNKKPDPFDSVMEDINANPNAPSRMPNEPPSFDSIKGTLPGGEFEVKKYKVKFTPDYVGGGFSYNTFFGVSGQSYFIFSDYLGNHQIIVATDLVNTIDQSNIQAYYLNNQYRINFGFGVLHTKNYYYDSSDFLFSDRFYGFEAYVSRPFSTFSRLELIGAQYFIDRHFYDFGDLRPKRSSKVTTGTFSYVTDNVLWGYTGPINGRRSKLSLTAGVDIFNANDIEFYSIDLDYRKYFHIKNEFSAAIRFSGGVSFGNTPKLYFLGGTTNWIGTRTLEAKVYDVENLYFADVVTPLRGLPYYGISGTRYGLINTEFRFPLVRLLALGFPLPLVLSNVSGVVFGDMGAAWTGNHFKGGTSEGGKKRLVDIHTGFGTGMRVNLFGLALLRYDVGWSTDFNKISDRPTHYFSFGADF